MLCQKSDKIKFSYANMTAMYEMLIILPAAILDWVYKGANLYYSDV